MTTKSRALWVDVAAGVGYAAVTMAFFYKVAFSNRVLAGTDVFAYFYPYREAVSEALKAGRLPLWNPYLFMGSPLLANSQAAVLYPLHWPLLWLSPPKQVAWSIVLHVWLGGLGTYLFARRSLHCRPPAAFAAGVLFALGGFVGAQVEHLNQLNASVWFPWLLLCLEGAWGARRWRWPALMAGGALFALVLLAGHTQAAYIVLAGVAIYAAVRGLGEARLRNGRRRLAGLRGLAMVSAMAVSGVALSAGQVLPTFELSRLSLRSGGLPYKEAASFSLKPGLVFKAFLPPFAWEPPFSEFVAYIGLFGLVLAGLGAWAVLRRRQSRADAGAGHAPPLGQNAAILCLALIGVFLAFGAYNPVYYFLFKLVPGFSLFRAPARWLFLYAFGASMLASMGLERLCGALQAKNVQRIPWGFLALLLVVLELFLASRRLAYNHPTAPAAFDSMRTAPAHLVAGGADAPWRFLSMSDITYDPGDLGDLQAAYSRFLPAREIYDLLVATKMKEVLAYNLPLRYAMYSVDGYDGGLLPSAQYATLEQLFIEPEDIWSDGRLRQQLKTVPSARLLSLLNVRYVITDKMQDVWLDGTFFDLEYTTLLGQATLAGAPGFEATRLGIVSHLVGAEDLADGTAVAEVRLAGTAGQVYTATLRAGVDTAEGLYSPETVAHRPGRVAQRWRQDCTGSDACTQAEGSDYLTVLDLGQPIRLSRIEVRSLLSAGRQAVALRGLTLIDGRTNTGLSVSVDPLYRLVHSGDVKIYENLAALPRAFWVSRARICSDDVQALSLIRQAGFDPSREVVIAEGRESSAESLPASTRLISYEPERAEWEVSAHSFGYLVVTDSYYPGWEAQVDGAPVTVTRADIYFRAIPLDAGQHRVTLRFRPFSVYAGLAIGAAAWLGWGIALAMAVVGAGRNSHPRV